MVIGREKVVVGTNKTNLILEGMGHLNTIIAWNDSANSTGGTVYSSSVAIFASKFIAYNLSFQVLLEHKITNLEVRLLDFSYFISWDMCSI